MSAWNKRLWPTYFAKVPSHLKSKRWRLMRLWHRLHGRQGLFQPSTPFGENAHPSPRAAKPAMQGSRSNVAVPKPPPVQRSLQWTKPNQGEVLPKLWTMTEIATENVIVYVSAITVVSVAQILHAEARVVRAFETDVIGAALEPDTIEPAHGLSEMIALLEAALVLSMITMSEADLGDANAVDLDLG
jgi:hypothetical protein